jgi:hypothetical protein
MSKTWPYMTIGPSASRSNATCVSIQRSSPVRRSTLPDQTTGASVWKLCAAIALNLAPSSELIRCITMAGSARSSASGTS